MPSATYPNARLGGLGIGISHTSHALGLLVEEDDVGDVTEFRTFVANVFFDFEDGGRIFLVDRNSFSALGGTRGRGNSALPVPSM